jgi:hypothetical protein
MCRLLFGAAVIVGFVCGGLVPATATPVAMPGFNSQNVEAALVEEAAYWRRRYRRYGYRVPYAYPPAYPPLYAYPPAYYPPPPLYAYPPAYPPPPAYGDYGDYPPANGDYGDYPPQNSY